MGLKWRTALLRNPDFIKLWSSETISQVGAQITQLSLQLVAVYTLEASAQQLGLLNAVSFAPFLGLTLFVGVWIDRVRRRPIMIASNLGRALIVGMIPALLWLGVLDMNALYLAAPVIGALTVMYDVSYQSYLPAIVSSDHLVEGNAKLQATTSIAQVGGLGVAGFLVQMLGAPITLLVNSLAYLVSAVTLRAIRARELPVPRVPKEASGIWRGVGEGLRFVFTNRYLRACAVQSGLYNLCWMSFQTLFLLYAARQLSLSASSIGIVLSADAIGALLGSLVAGPLRRRVGLGPAAIYAVGLCCLAPALVLFAIEPNAGAVALALGAFAVAGAGTAMANITIVSLRQTITPDRMLGRMNASYRFISWGCLPVGAYVGGLLGDLVGLRAALFATVIGFIVPFLVIACSPIRELQNLRERDVVLRGRHRRPRRAPGAHQRPAHAVSERELV